MTETERPFALVLAPGGRDASVAASLLSGLGTRSVICSDVVHLAGVLNEETCCAIATEESIDKVDLQRLAAWVSSQPSWSDLPFVVLTRRRSGPDAPPATSRIIAALGNVTFLERPFHPTTFASVVGTAIRGRHRQFEARSRIAELHESEARLHTALTAGQLGTWELDLTTHDLKTSATSKAVFGSSAQTLTYVGLLAAAHPDDRSRLLEAFRLSVETGQDCAIEYRNFWPDGSMHWADVRARLVRDGTTGHARLVGVSSDITARKAAEDHLLQIKETLETKVLERTAELEGAHQVMLEQIRQRERTEELLRQIQKMEMIGQLSGGVAHDFNNLLMVILANLELLQKLIAGNEKAERLVVGAIRGAHRGAALTQRLLAFARQQDLRIEAIELSRLIRDMNDLLERSIGPSIELRLDLPTTIPPTLVDANQIELAILNLVVNARDAMPDGGVLTISVDTTQASDDNELAAGSYVRVIVSDTGCGMDAETVAKATEPFFTTKGVGKGTGLGLSMVHGLTHQLNGALRLESEPGCGTRAALWLPSTARQIVSHSTVATPSKAFQSPNAAQPATILLVDDDPLIATSTAYLLEDLGHGVIEADSGARALEILGGGHKIDLVLTDYSMPKMTGVQLADALRELRPGLPVILATGYADLPHNGHSDIPRLRKPYQQQQLADEIEKALATPVSRRDH